MIGTAQVELGFLGVSTWVHGKYKSSLHVLIFLGIEMGNEAANWKELRLIRYQGGHFKETQFHGPRKW